MATKEASPQIQLFGEGDATQTGVGVRQVEVTKKGCDLVSASVRVAAPLLEAGLIVASNMAAADKRRFISNGPIAGGWHEVQLPGRSEPTLFRLDFEYPKSQEGAGFTQVEMAAKTVAGGVILPGKKDRVRVDVDAAHTGHVSGSRGGSPFHIDHLHAHSMYGELASAEALIADAHAGLDALLPSQDVAPVQDTFVPYAAGSVGPQA